MKTTVKNVFLIFLTCFSFSAFSQTVSDSDSVSAVTKPIKKTNEFFGVLKLKLETSTEAGVIRYNVRNSRLGVRGDIGDYLNYQAQVELSNEGKFDPLDLYATIRPAKNFSLTLGQQYVPFENVFIVSTAELMFANRAFLAKYFTPGSRDIGAVTKYRMYFDSFPLEWQFGVMNGGKINDPQWTDNPSFAFRIVAGSYEGFRSSVKVYKYNSEQLELLFWGVDCRYKNSRIRAEAELMNRHSYTTGLDLFGGYLQGSYKIDLPQKGMFKYIAPAARLDAMGYDGWNFDVKRITAGLQFGFTAIPYESLFRIDYEQYFVRKGLHFPDFDNRDMHVADNKLTVELVVKF